MIRKVIAAIAVGAVAALVPLGTAAAVTTPPVSETIEVSGESTELTQTGQSTPQETIDVSGESTDIAVQSSSADLDEDLSYTGVSFNVPLTLAIGAAIVAAGIALAVVGGRGVRRGSRQH